MKQRLAWYAGALGALVVAVVAGQAWLTRNLVDHAGEMALEPPAPRVEGPTPLFGLIEAKEPHESPGGNPDLARHERTVYSQNGEDGVLERIFELIPPQTRYAVEFGGGDGVSLSNVRNLILEHGFSALMIDGDEELVQSCAEAYRDREAATCLHAWVYPGNVELLFEEQGVPRDLDLLVIDIDSNDWYVWRAIRDFRPKVVQIEYNGLIEPPQRMVVDFHPMNYWDGTPYYGASIQSFADLGEEKGYELIYANQSGINLWFVERRYLERFEIPDNSPGALYRRQLGIYSLTPDQLSLIMEPDGTMVPRFPGELSWQDLRIQKRFRLDR